MASGLYIGIDVSKDRLEVAFGCDGEVREVANQDRAIAALAAELKELGPELVVMEASGGYEHRLRFDKQHSHSPIAHLRCAPTSPRTCPRRGYSAEDLLEQVTLKRRPTNENRTTHTFHR
jgi:hypothetical protein